MLNQGQYHTVSSVVPARYITEIVYQIWVIGEYPVITRVQEAVHDIEHIC